MYDGLVGAFDSFRVEEAYKWRDDVMEITRRIVHETDEARLNNIAEHFKVDLSEIREFLEMKRKKMQKPHTNADRIRAMTDEELAAWLCDVAGWLPTFEGRLHPILEWLKQETTDD